MKHFSLTFVFCYFIVFSSFAQVQEPKIKFGEVSKEELEMKIYSKDSSAEAVVLYDFGESYFQVSNADINIFMNVHERVKILKKSAYDRATVSFSLYKGGYQREEIITNIKGFTYNLDNGEIKKEKLTKDAIFNEKESNKYGVTKFTLPNVKEGSVIEYTYTLQTPFAVSANPKTWTFQNSIPVAWSEYKFTIPSYFYYRMLMTGYLGLLINQNKPVNMYLGNSSATGDEYRFVVKDAPAFRQEPFITTPADYLSKIDFELASVHWPSAIDKNFSLDYPTMNTTLLEDEDFGKQFQKTGFLKDIAKELKNKSTDTTAQIQAAYDYIRKTIKYNDGSGIYGAVKKAFEKQTGDAADINFLLVMLLREMGFEANPVILSTRSHGAVNEQYALLKRFNYVVAHVNQHGKDLLLDATDKYLPLGMLPTYCLNRRGWLVSENNGRFVSLIPTQKDVEFEKFELKIDPEGELQGTFLKSYGGFSAWNARTEFNKDGKDRFLEAVKKGKPSWTISKAEFNNTTDNDVPIEAKYELSTSDYLTKAGNLLYLKPLLSEAHSENSFKEPERAFPVDFGYPIEETFMAIYQIPKGYSVIEMPKSAAVSLPENGGKFTYLVNVTGDVLTVTSRLIFKKVAYFADEYPSLKQFYDKIIAKHNEQIVLKKN